MFATRSTMKRFIFFSYNLFSILSVVYGWHGTIVFEDNFDGNSLDLNKWMYQESCGDSEYTLMKYG